MPVSDFNINKLFVVTIFKFLIDNFNKFLGIVKMDYTFDSFLSNVIVPYFWGSIEKNINSVIYDIDGKIVVCTNKFAQMMGHNKWQQLKGKTILEYSVQMPQVDPNFYDNLEEIRKKVISECSNFQYVNFLYSAHGITSQMVYHFPIFMPNGEVVGSRVIANRFNMVDDAINKFMEYLQKYERDIELDSTLKNNEVNLNENEYSIIFLIGAGLNIEEISVFLDKPSNHILNILEKSVCKKFGLDFLDLKLIRQFALSGNIINKFPKKFMKPRSIILKHGESENSLEFKC